MKNIQNVVIAAVVAIALSTFALGQTVFKPTKVAGSTRNSLTAINNSGQVVANISTPTSDDVWVWTRLGGFLDLGLSGTNSLGVAISGAGAVVGSGDPDHSGNLQAFIWQPSAGTRWLGSLGGSYSKGSGVNAAGAVVGLSYTADETQHAFLWTEAGGMQDLTPDLTSVGGATAKGINSSNQVVGYYFPNGSNNTVGFSWTPAGGLQNLGPAGTLALAVNDAGTVVGQAPNARGYRHAFVWTQSGGIKDLGTLGGDQSAALGINNKGWIVGSSMTRSDFQLLHAFLWTPNGGMQDFTVLAGLNPALQPYSIGVNDYGVVALSTSGGVSLLIPKMTVTVASSLNPSHVGNPVTFTATMTSVAGAPPDGEPLEFWAANVLMGTAPLSNGTAQFTTSTLIAGSHRIIVKYAGDANYLAAKSPVLTQVVNP